MTDRDTDAQTILTNSLNSSRAGVYSWLLRQPDGLVLLSRALEDAATGRCVTGRIAQRLGIAIGLLERGFESVNEERLAAVIGALHAAYRELRAAEES